VDDFDHSAKLNGATPFVVEQLGGEEEHRRTNAFASALAQILSNFRDGSYPGNRVAAELALDGGKVIAEKLENLSSISGG